MLVKEWTPITLGLALMVGVSLSASATVDSDEMEQIRQEVDGNQEIISIQRPEQDSADAVVILDDSSYRVTTDGESLSDAMPQRMRLHLRIGSFDPLQDEEPRNVDLLNLAASEGDPTDREINTFIVQFKTQALPHLQEHIQALGGHIHRSLPHQALLVTMDANTLSHIQALPLVRWVGEYRLDHKIAPALQAQLLTAADYEGLNTYRLLLLNEEYGSAMRNHILSMGGRVSQKLSSKLWDIEVSPNMLLQLASRPEVEHVELWTPRESDMNLVREYGGANFLETVQLPGYTGEGVRAEVLDDGLLASHSDFQSRPPLLHGPESAQYTHGTSVYGIVFGDGTNDPRARGILPDAQQPIIASYVELEDREAHTARLVNPDGNYRAVFQTNSWGHGRTRAYTSISAQMDEIIFKHDLLITQSQSNAGTPDSRPEAWAKNIVSVGGFHHYNSLDKDRHRWANGASTGPAADGRIKPDLSHFYDSIWTTSSSGNYRTFGGTSGSTPITAGHFGLLFQLWADGVFEGGPGLGRDVFASRPHATTAKALLINTAFQYAFSGPEHDMARTHQGWGAANVRHLYERAENNNWQLPLLVDETKPLSPFENHRYTLSASGGDPLRVTMVYKDPAGSPSATIHRVNDLTLKVISPDGTEYWGNSGLLNGNWSTSQGQPNIVDTVENVFIEAPLTGTWILEIRGDEIVQDAHLATNEVDAVYALVVTGGGITPGSSSSSNSSASSSEGIPQWQTEEIYTEGQQVMYQGVIYEARWWITEKSPEEHSGPYAVWKRVDEYRASSSSSSSSSSLSSERPGTNTCLGLPTWNAEESYPEGQKVQYQHVKYQTKWQVRGVNPESYSGPYDAWLKLGHC
ncbi:S8 family peptidase [Marinimicrobium locisalis]|uniref:S8 family peptidase n=1 Tax=Marinimicrobium locisalis TaxID=546022 RepID=UPI003221B4BA